MGLSSRVSNSLDGLLLTSREGNHVSEHLLIQAIFPDVLSTMREYSYNVEPGEPARVV